MSKAKLYCALLIAAILASGCASGVSRPKTAELSKFSCSSNNPVGDIQLVLSEEGKTDLADNLKFSPEELKNHIERALLASSLINNELKKDLPLLVVEVKDIRVRSNFSAVMWGFMAGSDHITGDIVIKDKAGLELDRFEVSASYALGGIAGGMDSARMGWLYETFAEETVKELTKNSPQTTVQVQTGQSPKDKTVTEVTPNSSGAENVENEIKSQMLAAVESSQQRPEDIFKNGDEIALEFKNGETKEIILTHMNDRVIAGQYQYSLGQTTPVNYDRRNIKTIRYANEDPHKRYFDPSF